MLYRPVLVLFGLALAACSSYPDYKDNKELVCSSSKPFLTGMVSGRDGTIANWTNKEKVSSVHYIRRFAQRPDAAFGAMVVAFPDPQPVFSELKIQNNETIISSWTLPKNLERLEFKGRPYSVFKFKIADLKPYIGTTKSLEVVAYSEQGIETARQVVNIDYLAEALSEIDVMLAETKDMRDNRRSECNYLRMMTMPIEETFW